MPKHERTIGKKTRILQSKNLFQSNKSLPYRKLQVFITIFPKDIWNDIEKLRMYGIFRTSFAIFSG